MEQTSQSKIGTAEIAVLAILSFILIWFSRDFFFFWDNIVQLAVPANYYYDTNFATLYLPDAITTGHQPFAGLYLALGWKLLGRSVEVSHYLMLPFVFGVCYQLLRLTGFFLSTMRDRWFAFAAVLGESVVLTQMTLLTFEVFQIFFFLAVINSYLRKNNLGIVFFFCGLMLVSLRSTMTGIGFVIFIFLYQIVVTRKFSWREYLVFIPGTILFFAFLLSFYEARGWIVHNTVSKSWENAGRYASPMEMLKNIFLFGWRLFDLGKIIYLLLGVYIIAEIYKTKKIDHNFLTLLLIAAGQFIIFFIMTVPYQNYIGHRYLLPITTPLIIAIIYWFLTPGRRNHYFVYYILPYTLLGYIWIYPLRIAKGWDAMPAHWTYYELWRDMQRFSENQKIEPANIRTFFPNTATFHNITLADDHRRYANNTERPDYVLFSNVYNESDEVIQELMQSGKYSAVHTIQKGNIWMILLKKNMVHEPYLIKKNKD